jgi:uncharacterized protein YrrD
MRKVRDLVGLPVVELETGETVGEVRDVMFTGEGTFHSLLLERGGLLSAARILGKGQIHSLGEDAVTVLNRAVIETFRDETGTVRGLLEGDVHLVGKDVLTQNGNLLGRVEDVYVDNELYTIVGYEVSEGFLTDLKEGRKVLRAHPDFMVGGDTLLVPEDTELAEEF